MSSEPFDRADQATPAGLGDRLDDLLLRAESWVAGSRAIVVALSALLVAGVAAWLALAPASEPDPIEASIPLAQPATIPTEAPTVVDGAGRAEDESRRSARPESDPGPDAPTARGEPEELVVHVVGAVRRPGLVDLAVGDRISDAVDAAGGADVDADLERLNLATQLVDGMQIRVPSVDESAEGAPIDEPLVQLPATGGGGGGDPGPRPGTVPGPIDLNRADENELQQLPGIGPALAARITTWRAENGGFASVDELESVPGIGPAKLAGLRDQVTV